MQNCPQCQHALTWVGQDQYQCSYCQQHYLRQTLCPDCKQALQLLQGCGATDYWCSSGHGLISSKRVIFQYIGQ